MDRLSEEAIFGDGQLEVARFDGSLRIGTRLGLRRCRLYGEKLGRCYAAEDLPIWKRR